MLFGKPSGNLASPTTRAGTLFGKTAAPVESQTPPTKHISLYDKLSASKAPTSTTAVSSFEKLAEKEARPLSSGSRTLFGKPIESGAQASPQTSGTLFGKPAPEQDSIGRSSSQSLFGKPAGKIISSFIFCLKNFCWH